MTAIIAEIFYLLKLRKLEMTVRNGTTKIVSCLDLCFFLLSELMIDFHSCSFAFKSYNCKNRHTNTVIDNHLYHKYVRLPLYINRHTNTVIDNHLYHKYVRLPLYVNRHR
jgi:hypothetical protein